MTFARESQNRVKKLSAGQTSGLYDHRYLLYHPLCGKGSRLVFCDPSHQFDQHRHGLFHRRDGNILIASVEVVPAGE